jgi:hypothetical protein
MKNQNYKNHTQIVFTYHVLTGLSLIVLIIGAVRNVFKGDGDEDLYNATLILLVALILVSLHIHARMFALKAQDRAIRAEESLRYFVLTGKLFDSRLNLQQIIALRFASDEELPALAQKAAEQGMSNKEIKKAIRIWRADHHRV